MKPLLGVAAILSLACFIASPARAAKQQMSDSLCPGAISAVHGVASVPQPYDPVRAAYATESAVEAFRICYYRAVEDGNTEPLGHYAQTRIAQFEVLLGRAYMAQQRWDDAHAAFAEASRISESVAVWRAPTYGYVNPRGGVGRVVKNYGANNHSQFQDSAKEIAQAADVELEKLVPAGTMRRQAAAPAPSPSP
jgi:hypothetical protein